jgi:hypothetical protein
MSPLAPFHDRKTFTTLGNNHILVQLSRLPAQYRTKQTAMEQNIIAAYRANAAPYNNYVFISDMLRNR